MHAVVDVQHKKPLDSAVSFSETTCVFSSASNLKQWCLLSYYEEFNGFFSGLFALM